MNNLYKIIGTSNIDPEQNNYPYTDENFWPNFQEDMINFKNKLIKSYEENNSLTLLRVGHSEHCLFNLLVPYNNNKKGKFLGNNGTSLRHFSKKQTKETWIKIFESIYTCDYFTTQIGIDFKNWARDIIHYKNIYVEFKNKNQIDFLFNNLNEFNLNYNDKYENIDMPLDIVYGLISNKWLLETFKNQIALIGNCEKLSIIQELIKHEPYKKYICNDYFLDYIKLPQTQALEYNNIENYIYENVKNSNSRIFFIGAGVSKLKFFYKLKEIKPNGIFIDIGYGIDAIAGIADYGRPYFGSWQNYKLKNYNYNNIDFCGKPHWNNVIML